LFFVIQYTLNITPELLWLPVQVHGKMLRLVCPLSFFKRNSQRSLNGTQFLQSFQKWARYF